MRIALGLEYDGSAFQGWQSQPDGRTVQDQLEAALQCMAGHAVRTYAAGRTDTGVHALSQVIHFNTDILRPMSAWCRGTNAHLPPTICVRWAIEVDGEFHARYSARARHYQYLLLNSPLRPAIDRQRCGWFHLPLDATAMQRGADLLLGEHDFSAFRAAECQAKSAVKAVSRAAVGRHGEFVIFDFRADAFLQHMVRNIVGALVYVGKGKHDPEWIGELLARKDRSLCAPTFSACGLYLAGVEYDARWQLPPTRRMIAALPSATI